MYARKCTLKYVRRRKKSHSVKHPLNIHLFSFSNLCERESCMHIKCRNNNSLGKNSFTSPVFGWRKLFSISDRNNEAKTLFSSQNLNIGHSVVPT